MIYFDELSVAQNMESATEKSEDYKMSDVLLYAKYLRYKKIIENGIDYNTVTKEYMESISNQIEKELICFCETYYSDFNYVVKFQDIDHSVKASTEYKLKLPLPINITRHEYNSLMEIEEDNLRRLLFIMLVDSKYGRIYNTSIVNKQELNEATMFYTRMTESESIKAGKCKFTKDEKFLSLGRLYKKGFIGITNNQYCATFVKIVDLSDDDIVETVTNFEQLDLHYERMMGEMVVKCAVCNRMFKQNKFKSAMYCYKHRSANKPKPPKKKMCVSCFKFFDSPPKSKRNRCDECYEKYRKEYWRIKYLDRKNQLE